MATHGEKPWPPAGRSDGRLWGGFHGHRQELTSGKPRKGSSAPRSMARSVRRHSARPGSKLCSSKADLQNRPNERLAPTIAANRPRLSLGGRLMPGTEVALTIRKTC
jgi:hypothetical protein